MTLADIGEFQYSHSETTDSSRKAPIVLKIKRLVQIRSENNNFGDVYGKWTLSLDRRFTVENSSHNVYNFWHCFSLRLGIGTCQEMLGFSGIYDVITAIPLLILVFMISVHYK